MAKALNPWTGRSCFGNRALSSTAKLRIWTLRLWVLRGPGFRSARQVLCGNASCLFVDHFSWHLSSVLGRQSSVMRSGIPGPKNPKSSATKTTIWHCSTLVKAVLRLQMPFRGLKLVSTKTLLLKHYYRRQGEWHDTCQTIGNDCKGHRQDTIRTVLGHCSDTVRTLLITTSWRKSHLEKGLKSQERKPAQRGSFWDGHPADIRGSFARISRDSRPRTSVRAVKILEKQAFWRGHPWPEGADVHSAKGFPKTSVRKTLGWIFVP